jgi:hypothetical protein
MRVVHNKLLYLILLLLSLTIEIRRGNIFSNYHNLITFSLSFILLVPPSSLSSFLFLSHPYYVNVFVKHTIINDKPA